MIFHSEREFWNVLGLRPNLSFTDFDDDHFISHQGRDLKSGLLAGLVLSIDKTGANHKRYTMVYDRMMPDGTCYSHRLFELAAETFHDGTIQLSNITVQSRQVYDGDNQTPENVNRILAAFNRMTRLIRNRQPIENANLVLSESKISAVIGEKILLRNLNEAGGFLSTPSLDFRKSAGLSMNSLGRISRRSLLNLLGYSRNTIEPDLDYAPEHRHVHDTHIDTGKRFVAASNIDADPDYIRCTIHTSPYDDSGLIVPFVTFGAVKNDNDEWCLAHLSLKDQKIDENSMAECMPVLAALQAVNQDFVQHDYAAFMDALAESDLLGRMDVLPPPDPTKPYEFLYGSLHGTSMNKTIEFFGDQIGIASVFLHRQRRADGTTSTVGVAVDFPFAVGGPDSRFDGAVPNYLPFWSYISHIFITHDHFDHNGGLAIYAKAGLMRDKNVVCSPSVRRSCEAALNNLSVPKALWPRFEEPKPVMQLRNRYGEICFHIQSCLNAVEHSAHTTPYIITPCLDNKNYGAPVLVYGDATGFTKEGKAFFKEGAHALRTQFGFAYPEAAPAIGMALHDVTAWKNEGFTYTEEAVDQNLGILMRVATNAGRSPVLFKFSTNQREDKIILDRCNEQGLDVTCIGANQEQRFATMNQCGVLPNLDLREVVIPDEVVPQEVWAVAGDILDQAKLYVEKKLDKDPNANYDDAMRRGLLLYLNKYRKDLIEEGIDPQRSTHFFMLRSLLTEYKVTFRYNDVNSYLMYKAILDGKEQASLYRSRTSLTAKEWRKKPEKLAIIATGPIGNISQYFATGSKWTRGTSLLDSDEQVRPTAFTMDDDALCPIIIQPGPTKDDESPQAQLVGDMVRHKNTPVFVAIRDGFVAHNLQDIQADFIQTIQTKKWVHRRNGDGSITVMGRSIHIHGHGFREDCKLNVQAIPARLHVPHHIPDMQCFDLFNDDVRAMGFKTPDIKEPQDSIFYSIDFDKNYDVSMTEKVRLPTSYILYNNDRPFGQHYRGSVTLTVATLLRTDGHDAGNGFSVMTQKDGVYETAVNASYQLGPALHFQRARKTGPAPANRREARVRPRSRPACAPPPGSRPAGSLRYKAA